eukprot:3814035-Pleurochrysis_carterae.AAC.1
MFYLLKGDALINVTERDGTMGAKGEAVSLGVQREQGVTSVKRARGEGRRTRASDSERAAHGGQGAGITADETKRLKEQGSRGCKGLAMEWAGKGLTEEEVQGRFHTRLDDETEHEKGGHRDTQKKS